MSEDYYDILGIGKDADSRSIRRAYRREAKKSHPDSSGDGHSSERFRRVEEAYETLGDAERRQAYDRGQGRTGSPGTVNRPHQRSGGAPLREGPTFFRPAEAAAAAETAAAAFGPHVGAAGRDGPLLEILLSAREAMEGVEVPVEVPLSLPCPECSGGGFWTRMFCFTCGGRGTIRTRERLVLQIPPGIRNGREFLIGSGAGSRTGSNDPFATGIRVRVLVH